MVPVMDASQRLLFSAGEPCGVVAFSNASALFSAGGSLRICTPVSAYAQNGVPTVSRNRPLEEAGDHLLSSLIIPFPEYF